MAPRPAPRATPAEVMTFLRTSPERYCAACVALKLGGTLEETRPILGGLHSQGAPCWWERKHATAVDTP